MDQGTHEVRAEYWRGIIKACNERPAGQSAKQWMKENGITEQSYYSWQRRFRKEAYEQMQTPAVAYASKVSFAEISIPSQPMDFVNNNQVAATIRF